MKADDFIEAVRLAVEITEHEKSLKNLINPHPEGMYPEELLMVIRNKRTKLQALLDKQESEKP